MTLEAKGRIKFNPDVKPGEPEYIIEAKQLGIVEKGSGNIGQMMDELTERVRRAIADEFCVAPSSVQIVGYAMGITFAVEGPVNHALSDFTEEKELEDNTEMEITLNGGAPIKTDMKHLNLATKVMKVAAETGRSPEEVLAAAKKRAGIKGSGAE